MELWLIYKQEYEEKSTYAPQMMLNSAIKHGIDAKVFFDAYFSIIIENGEEKLFYKNVEIKNFPDFAFFRCYDFTLMHACENKGVKLINTLQGMQNSRNKYTTTLLTNNLKIKTPKTIQTINYNYNDISKHLGKTFVIKDNFGEHGDNVFLINNAKELQPFIDKPNYIFQEYIKESCGKDIRLYVVGDKVIGAIERFSVNGDFRSNVSLGGESKVISIPKTIETQTIKLAKKMGLTICGIDYLFDGKNYLLCEVNGNAGLSIFIKAGKPMQDIFMTYILSLDNNN